jgi:YD repeat-containing protein
LNTTGGTLTDTRTFYDTGMVNIATDPGGHQTTYSYDGTFYGAYVTQTQLPSTNSPNLAQHITNDWYDLTSGVLAWHKDQNQQQTTYTYDNMWRIKSITYPSAGGSVSYNYDDTPGSLYVEIQHTIDSTRSTNEFIFFDGVGRQISQSRANDETSNPPYDKIDTCYDALGSKSFVSFPYQTSSYNGSPNCSGSGDSYTYDGLRRVTAVTHSTGGTITTSYYGPATSVTDEGNGITTTQKISQVDGLGRLTSVCEVTGSNLTGVTGSVAPCSLDIAGTGFLTTYQYDALDNLLAVNQGGLPQRQFTYDSLSRLITANNPETGTTCYGTWSGSSCVNGYDVDSNLIQRTRPAPNGASGYVTTTYSYDALHRLLSTQYSDGTDLPPAFVHVRIRQLGLSRSHFLSQARLEVRGSVSPFFRC